MSRAPGFEARRPAFNRRLYHAPAPAVFDFEAEWAIVRSDSRTEDLKKIDVPTLIVHGDDDQIVPIDASGRASARLVKEPTLKVYPGAPHGLADTHKEQLNADLLEFIKA
jgi:pimeloyl-ACP methyl ester carboxylesterase